MKSLRNRLYDKLQKEHEQYQQELLQLSKEQIIDKAYEITTKEDIKCLLEIEVYSSKEYKKFLSVGYVIETLYQHWLSCDVLHMDELRITIREYLMKV